MTATGRNPYCNALGIDPPCLERAANAASASFYSLLLLALLERGAPLTLEEVAARIADAGIATAGAALASLKRCRPARPPVYRDGDRYGLDPHHDEAGTWVFRLGLRPPPPVPAVPPAPAPRLPDDQPLTAPELRSAWRRGIPAGWSAQRIAVCVLEVHGGAMPAEDVVAFARNHAGGFALPLDATNRWLGNAAVQARGETTWELLPDHPALRSARRAARELAAKVEERARRAPDPESIAQRIELMAREEAAEAERLSRLRRVLIHAFPLDRPRAVVLLDVERHTIETWMGDDIATCVPEKLNAYGVLIGAGVRGVLQALGVDSGARRLEDLATAPKSRSLNRRGRKLVITLGLLVLGSCGIGRALDPKVLRRYAEAGELTKLRRRLESDAKALLALYEYGRLHKQLRLQWGFIDEMVPAAWVHRHEASLHEIMREAHGTGTQLEVVVGSAPGWNDPWARGQRVRVERVHGTHWFELVEVETGRPIDERLVQRARRVGPRRAEMDRYVTPKPPDLRQDGT